MPALHRRDGLFLWVPHLLVAAPFFLAGAAYALWAPAVAAAALGLGHLGRRLTRCDDGVSIRGPVLAVLVTGTLLLHLGLSLAVRLVVARDPLESFREATGTDDLRTAWPVLIEPILGLLIAIAAVNFRNRIRLFEGRRPAWITAVVTIPFLLPLVTGAGRASLTFGPIATPEYGKLLLCGALAMLVARDGYRFHDVHLLRSLRRIRQASGGMLRRPALVASYRASRFLLVPIGLFGLVAVASGLRRDFGTIVPAALITMGVTWSATRHNLDRDRAADPAGAQRWFRTPRTALGAGRKRRAGTRRWFRRSGTAVAGPDLVLAYRLFIGVAVVLIGGAVTLLATDYVGERGRVWSNPWRYRWDAPCLVIEAPRVHAPDGRVPCLRSLAADAESEESQVAGAVAATADGGLWGRGIADRASAAVSAGPTDFVLAVIWNKLGGLVVIAAGAVVLILAAGLVRAAEHEPVARLFAAGLGAMIAGQYLFVLATTANVVPHTGIPAPLLSRGGQSTLALLIGIVIVLAGARRSIPVTTAPRRVVSTTLTAGMLSGIVAVLTLVPYSSPAGLRVYSQRRPPCPARPADPDGLQSPRPDPRVCSTDRIAPARTRVALTFPGSGRLILDRPAHRWRPDRHGDLDGDDLRGVTTLLERTYPEVVAFSAGAGLRRRLLPAERDRVDGGLALTLDPGLQHALAATMTGPEPAAVVALDPAGGRIRASASGPMLDEESPVDAGAAEKFADQHRYYVRREPGPSVDDAAADRSCERRSPDPAMQFGCWRWSYTRPDPPGSEPVHPFGPVADLLRQAAPGLLADCGGPDRWTVPVLAGSAGSCPDQGTPLTVAVLAGAVCRNGQGVHPRLVESVTWPATGATEPVPGRPAETVLSPAVAQALQASFVRRDGLRLFTGASGGTHWAAGWDEAGTAAFAVVVRTTDGTVAGARIGRVLDVLRDREAGR
ncbi:FtsW/RodA/SpoVE family cell cycle protein [Actinoplanes sp. NPDC020271]|uniref:FtsW/RodA/SpoVE family cell cycle protein n=1 Tax=Actinoplanes sp. NPDC020271 TaxID=3363896 RepID=UPI0037A3A306